MAVSDMQIPIILGSDRATQPIIAPVQENLTAKQAYAVGSYFIFNNGMYIVTAAITQGANIVIGTESGCNARAYEAVTEDLYKLKSVDIPANKSTTASGNLLLGTDVDSIFNTKRVYPTILLSDNFTATFTYNGTQWLAQVLMNDSGTYKLVKSTVISGKILYLTR